MIGEASLGFEPIFKKQSNLKSEILTERSHRWDQEKQRVTLWAALTLEAQPSAVGLGPTAVTFLPPIPRATLYVWGALSWDCGCYR